MACQLFDRYVTRTRRRRDTAFSVDAIPDRTAPNLVTRRADRGPLALSASHDAVSRTDSHDLGVDRFIQRFSSDLSVRPVFVTIQALTISILKNAEYAMLAR